MDALDGLAVPVAIDVLRALTAKVGVNCGEQGGRKRACGEEGAHVWQRCFLFCCRSEVKRRMSSL